MHQGKFHHSAGFVLICSALILLTGGFPVPRGPRRPFYFPNLFLPDTEVILLDAPLFARFEGLIRELNRLSLELEHAAFRAAARREYQHALNEAVRAEKDLAGWLRDQNVAAEEIGKLEGIIASQVSSAPREEDGDGGGGGGEGGEGEGESYDRAGEGAASLPGPGTSRPGPNTVSLIPAIAAPAAGSIAGKPKIRSTLGKLITQAGPGAIRRPLGPEPKFTFKGDPRETMNKFGQFFTGPAPKPRSFPRTVTVYSAPETVAGSGPTPPAVRVGRLEEAQEPVPPTIEEKAPVEASVGEPEDLGLTSSLVGNQFLDSAPMRRVRGVLGALPGFQSNPQRGAWTLLVLALAVLLSLPALFRRAVLGVIRRNGGDLDFTAIPHTSMAPAPALAEDISTGPRISGESSFSVVWNRVSRAWMLTQRLEGWNVSRVVAELREGTVVYGNILGMKAEQRYKLAPTGEWIPTEETERLVLDVREGLRHRN